MHADTSHNGDGPSHGLGLPPYVHIQSLRILDPAGAGARLAYVIVWADRPYTTCPRCHRHDGVRIVAHCPVAVDVGGGLVEAYQRHSCGEPLPGLRWMALAGDLTDLGEKAVRAAQSLAAGYRESVAIERAALVGQLRHDLRRALGRVGGTVGGPDAALVAAEVTTGSDLQPGVYLDSRGQWVAWDYDPDGSGDPVTVTPVDLADAPRPT